MGNFGNPGPVQAVNQTHEKIDLLLTECWSAVTRLLIPVSKKPHQSNTKKDRYITY
jgi:hypothetical protein